MNVFIVGIAGRTGSRVAELLAQRGDTVHGLYRLPEQANGLQAIGATGTLGDVATISEQRLASAASGADVIVFAAGAGPHDSDAMVDAVDGDGILKAIAAARILGISRVFLVSVFPEAGRDGHFGDGFEHYMSAKKRADVALVHSGLDWLILRPSTLTDDPGTGRVSLTPAEMHVNISRDDLAATIAALLHSPDLRRRIFEVTAGATMIPEALTALLP